jgi:hypothetical protein
LFSIFITLPSLIIRIIPLSYFVFNKTGEVKKDRSAAFTSGQAGFKKHQTKGAIFKLLYFYHKSILFSNEKDISNSGMLEKKPGV